jgi:hypothetical protein
MSGGPPEELLWNLMRGVLTTKALGIASNLGVADALAGRPRPVADLAAELGADADTLHRILRALASDGVFAEDEPGVFRNTEASELLGRDRNDRWPEFAHLFGGVVYDAVSAIGPQTRGETFSRAFGTDFWSWLAANPEERRTFDRAMTGGRADIAARLAALAWRDGETVVDVGGGNGALLRELLAVRPGLHGVVFDLPETARDEQHFEDGLDFVAGSFFEQVPPGDVYLLSRILHDWDDERAAAILHTVRASAQPETRVLLVEAVVPPGNEPHGSKWLDLLMLVLGGGRERTEADWRALLERSGFEPVQIADGLIEARPAGPS